MSISNVKINIRDLPEIQEMTAGDYLIVETPDGTCILDYENLVLEETNTAISYVARQAEAAVYALSADTQIKLEQQYFDLSNQITSTYIGTAKVVIEQGDKATATLSPRPPDAVGDISMSEVTIIPANEAACKYPAYVYFIDNMDDARGTITIHAPMIKQDLYVNANFTNTLSADIVVDDFQIGNKAISQIAHLKLNEISTHLVTVVSGELVSTNDVVEVVETETNAQNLKITPAYYIKVIKTY